ncbi:hypothetical protein M569_06485 [Genlisea aurea]|uniref:HTH La-type RNA-binding domain-containing protein n=1 Tax=Genlisea aurea TaxID=192259 RepID=S8CNI1_9LAMI|nr:hypothetical protein M569_06485 [Genlisea aurea]
MSSPRGPTSASEDSKESSRAEAQTESSDANGDVNAATPRRSVWNRPSNCEVVPGSVMGGAVAWPALSELTRPGTRSSAEVTRPITDGSSSSSQSPAVSQGSQRQVNNANNHNSSSHNSPRVRSRNRVSDSSSGGGPSHNNLNRPLAQAPPPFPAFRVPYPIVPPVLDNPMTGPRPFRGVSQGNDHSSNRNGSRRGNYGPRPRGDGARRDQDRRDIHVMPPPYMPHPGFMPPPMQPAAPPFLSAPVAVFPGQMGFDINASLMYPADSFRPIPIVQSPPPLLFSPTTTEGHLPYMILRQIEYYFSDENLIKDDFLRNRMDEGGWVPISLIASFRRVQNLTNDIPTILDSLSQSTVLEIQPVVKKFDFIERSA